MGDPARKLPPDDTGVRPAAKVIHWNGRDLPAELPELPPGQYQIVAVPAGLELQPGDEALTDATLDEVGAWLDGKAACPWPR